jgi:hypothetical protein
MISQPSTASWRLASRLTAPFRGMLLTETEQWVGTGRTAKLCFPIPPVVTVHATFTAYGGRLRGFYGPECSGGIGKDSQALSSDGMTTHPPLKLWPCAMGPAFPCSDYDGHADSLLTHRRVSGLFPALCFRSPYHRRKGLPCSPW